MSESKINNNGSKLSHFEKQHDMNVRFLPNNTYAQWAIVLGVSAAIVVVLAGAVLFAPTVATLAGGLIAAPHAIALGTSLVTKGGIAIGALILVSLATSRASEKSYQKSKATTALEKATTALEKAKSVGALKDTDLKEPIAKLEKENKMFQELFKTKSQPKSAPRITVNYREYLKTVKQEVAKIIKTAKEAETAANSAESTVEAKVEANAAASKIAALVRGHNIRKHAALNAAAKIITMFITETGNKSEDYIKARKSVEFDSLNKMTFEKWSITFLT